MAMTAIIFTGIAALLVIAIARKPEAITMTLAAFFAASVPVGMMLPHDRLMPVMAFMDAAMVIQMAALWTAYGSQRARIVGSIGLSKVAWAMWAYSFSQVNYFSYATALNGAFVVQIVIAGDFLDAVGRWLVGLHRRAHHGLVGRNRHVGG